MLLYFFHYLANIQIKMMLVTKKRRNAQGLSERAKMRFFRTVGLDLRQYCQNQVAYNSKLNSDLIHNK